MMTKKQYAKMVVDRYIRENCKHRPIKDYSELVKYIYSSTKLGIALEELGIISEYGAFNEEWRYLHSRSGMEYIHYDEESGECWVLTTRELISMLPDENPPINLAVSQ